MATTTNYKPVDSPASPDPSSTTNTSSSPLIKISLFVAIPIITALIIMTTPIMLVLVPVTFLPTVILYKYYQKATRNSSARISSSKLLTVYLLSGTIGMLLVILVQSALTYLAGFLIFGSDLDSYMKEFGRSESELDHADADLVAKRAYMASQPRYWVFLFVLMFDIVATTEEMLKYVSIPLTLKYLLKRDNASIDSPTANDDNEETNSRRALLSQPATEKAYIPIIVATTLGFSTLENIGFIYAAAVTGSEPPLRLLQTVIERLFISTPGHVLTALYMGTAMIARNSKDRPAVHASLRTNTPEPHGHIMSIKRFLRVVATPIVFHGSFDFVLLAISALNGNPGWIHPRSGLSMVAAIAAVLSLQVTLALKVRSKWTRYQVSL